MKVSLRYVLLPLLAFALTVPSVVNATNGYFLIGFGAKSRAMGGTGVANNTDGMAAAFNPASMIESSESFDLGAEFFRPQIAIQHDSITMGPANETSNHDKFIIPSMGGVYRWNDKIALGAAFIGAGLKTEFDQTSNNSACTELGGVNCPPTVFNAFGNLATGEAGVELYQMQMLPSIAYKLNDEHTVGATLVMAGQYFRAEGLEDFAVLGYNGTNPADLMEAQDGLTGVGFSHSFGLGYRLGWLGKFLNEDLTLGINYSARVHMSKFARYNKLFAEQGDFDIPENYTIGAAYAFADNVTVAFDVQKIMYSDIASVGNPGPDASDPSTFFELCVGDATNDACLLGGAKGLGFGWTDQTIYKLGVDWQYTDELALRAGWNYGEAPIPEDQVLFNMLAPATVEHHLTLGAEYKFNEDYWLSVNYMHAFLNTIKGPTVFSPVSGAVVTGSNASIAMVQDTLGATLSIRF